MRLKLIPIEFFQLKPFPSGKYRESYNSLEFDSSMRERILSAFTGLVDIDEKSEVNTNRGIYYDFTIHSKNISNFNLLHELGHFLVSENRDLDNYGLGRDYLRYGSRKDTINSQEEEEDSCIISYSVYYSLFEPAFDSIYYNALVCWIYHIENFDEWLEDDTVLIEPSIWKRCQYEIFTKENEILQNNNSR